MKLNDVDNIFFSLQMAVTTSPDNPLNKLREFIIGDVPEGGRDIYSNMVSILIKSRHLSFLATEIMNVESITFFVLFSRL